jgi:hypothetical protein
MIWIGHALAGRAAAVAKLNGNGNGALKSKDANRIVASSKERLAPTTIKNRSLQDRKGSGLAEASKKLEERGDSESAEEFVAQALSKGRSHPREVQRIG